MAVTIYTYNTHIANILELLKKAVFPLAQPIILELLHSSGPNTFVELPRSSSHVGHCILGDAICHLADAGFIICSLEEQQEVTQAKGHGGFAPERGKMEG